MGEEKQGLKMKKPPQTSRFDRGPRDFWRGSRGMNVFKPSNKSFVGMRRGSK